MYTYTVYTICCKCKIQYTKNKIIIFINRISYVLPRSFDNASIMLSSSDSETNDVKIVFERSRYNTNSFVQ